MSDPVTEVDAQFHDTLAQLTTRPHRPTEHDEQLCALFAAQAASRHLDVAARNLGAAGTGYYSIGSSGHESNAAVAAALRPSDPALLHYRAGGFYVRRAHQVPSQEPLRDVLSGVVAAAADPISGGRHKVFGNADLAVIPQTSTIASHLPRATGLAFALGRAAKLGIAPPWPTDSVVACSFGDAAVNHSTATGAINAALQCSYQGLPMRLLWVCEDNGLGISVRTPRGWVENAFAARAGLAYFTTDGDDPLESLRASARAVDQVRRSAAPALLHLRTVRLFGHAGSDVESAYRSREEIRTDQERDPLLATARTLVERGISTPEQLRRDYEQYRAEVERVATEVTSWPKLDSAQHVMAPIHRERPELLRERAQRTSGALSADERVSTGGATAGTSEVAADGGQHTFAQAVNRALTTELAHDRRVLVFGEDVARKGGVYGVTRGLHRAFGGSRVFDTLLDEQSILGTALGTGLAGMLPIPEIQYLAYLHNAFDQIRGEASTLRFFANGQYTNPMVVRVPSYAYQKGFGGHFHNDNSIAALRDIPGVVVASPSLPDDAAAMLHTCVSAAAEEGRVCLFLEPIAAYHTRDLYEHGDAARLAHYPRTASTHVPVGRARQHGNGSDLVLVSFGNGVDMSLRVAQRLARRDVRARVLDLRWLAPLPVEDLVNNAAACGRVLVVDETRRSGGVSESVCTTLLDNGWHGEVSRVTSTDSFVPLGPAAQHVLLDEATIETAAWKLLAR